MKTPETQRKPSNKWMDKESSAAMLSKLSLLVPAEGGTDPARDASVETAETAVIVEEEDTDPLKATATLAIDQDTCK